MVNYGFVKSTSLNFEEAEKRVREEAGKEGFGILTRIDMQEKFKEKLGVDFKKYVILGACNPPNAFKAVQAEENIGLFLPCNIIVYEKDDKTVVSAVKPTVAMGMIENESLKVLAIDIENKLKNIIDRI